MEHRILFVCMGNICRSPAAEGIMRHMAGRQGAPAAFKTDSAGTYGGHAGELPDRRMRLAAARRGYDLVHRSRRIVSDDFDRFDMIVVMDDDNYENVCRMAHGCGAIDKVFRMAEFIGRNDIDHVPDPYYEGADGFEYVLDLLEEGCANLMGQLIGEAAVES